MHFQCQTKVVFDNQGKNAMVLLGIFLFEIKNSCSKKLKLYPLRRAIDIYYYKLEMTAKLGFFAITAIYFR